MKKSESDFDSTQKPPTPCDTDSTTLVTMTHSDSYIFLLYPTRKQVLKATGH